MSGWKEGGKQLLTTSPTSPRPSGRAERCHVAGFQRCRPTCRLVCGLRHSPDLAQLPRGAFNKLLQPTHVTPVGSGAWTTGEGGGEWGVGGKGGKEERSNWHGSAAPRKSTTVRRKEQENNSRPTVEGKAQ